MTSPEDEQLRDLARNAELLRRQLETPERTGQQTVPMRNGVLRRGRNNEEPPPYAQYVPPLPGYRGDPLPGENHPGNNVWGLDPDEVAAARARADAVRREAEQRAVVRQAGQSRDREGQGR